MSPPPGNIVNFPERAAIEEEAARDRKSVV